MVISNPYVMRSVMNIADGKMIHLVCAPSELRWKPEILHNMMLERLESINGVFSQADREHLATLVSRSGSPGEVHRTIAKWMLLKEEHFHLFTFTGEVAARALVVQCSWLDWDGFNVN